jgi:hypothetical protein
MAIASWPTRRVACVAGTGAEPGEAGLQSLTVAVARRRGKWLEDLVPWP